MKPGERLGRYELIAPLGRGGMGIVWRARDSRLSREVAIKLLSPDVVHTPDAFKRLEQEARAVAALAHPNIVSVFDLHAEDDMPFVVTELLEGETLGDRIARGRLDWRDVARLGSEIASGLAAAHARGILHRDLKPENIFITTEERVKILDFGLAKIAVAQNSDSTTGIHLTEPGMIMGTVGYIAPEQLRGEIATAKSDLFALGCVFHEMLSGARPFDGASVAEIIAAILKDDPPQLSRDSAPSAVLTVVESCLEKEPSRRPDSAEDVARDLRLAMSETDATPRVRRPAARRWWVGAALAALVGTIAVLLLISQKRTAPSTRISSVAVLPFEGSSGDPAVAYLSDGIAESLINTLSEIDDLRVVSRSTAFRYRGATPDLRRLQKELNIDAVITGRVAKLGDRLAIDASFVDVADDMNLWGRKFVTPVGDLVTVERDITRAIVDELKLKLTTADQAHLDRRLSSDSEAYRLYLLGRYHWNKLTPADVTKAISYFEQAIARDRNYALAYSGLADSHLVLGVHGGKPHEEMPKARAAAEKALALNPTLAEAHASLGAVKFYYDWDWQGANAELNRAIELNPNYPSAHHARALYLMRVGRGKESIEEMQRALALDPFALVLNIDLAIALYYAGDVRGAVRQMERTLELHPTSALVNRNMSLLYEEAGDYEAMLAALERAAKISATGEAMVARLQETYRRDGIEAFRRARIREELAAKATSYRLAVQYAPLDREKTIEYLAKAVEDHDSNVGIINVSPRFASLRGDVRFQALVQKIGLARAGS